MELNRPIMPWSSDGTIVQMHFSVSAAHKNELCTSVANCEKLETRILTLRNSANGDDKSPVLASVSVVPQYTQSAPLHVTE